MIHTRQGTSIKPSFQKKKKKHNISRLCNLNKYLTWLTKEGLASPDVQFHTNNFMGKHNAIPEQPHLCTHRNGTKSGWI